MHASMMRTHGGEKRMVSLELLTTLATPHVNLWFSSTVAPGSGVKWPPRLGFPQHSQLLFDSGIPVPQTR